MQTVREQAIQLKKSIDNADAIVIGIGSGLTAAGGIDVKSKELLEGWMPEYQKQGFENVLQVLRKHLWFDEGNASYYWAFWSKFIFNLRYEQESLTPYLALKKLLDEKNYFIINTTVDGQLEKAGFPMDKVLSIQGDMAYSQCYKPCSNERYYNQKEISKMVSHTSPSGVVREDYLVRCPKCGNYLVPNIRTEDNFVAEPYLSTNGNYHKFLKDNQKNHLLFLEIGEGFNHPGFIRYPFENFTQEFEHGFLLRMNEKDPEIPENLKKKSYAIDRDIEATLLGALNLSERF